MFPSNNSQLISHPSNSCQRPHFQGIPNAPRPLPPITQVQPPPGHIDIDQIERRLNNMEKMMRLMTEQFSQLASSFREPGTFPSQPEVNPKGLPSSSGLPPNDNVRKINVVISLRSG